MWQIQLLQSIKKTGTHMSELKFHVVNIEEQPDGSSKVILEFDDHTKKTIMQLYGWKRWNTKKFQQLFKKAIHNYIEYNEKEGSNDGNI